MGTISDQFVPVTRRNYLDWSTCMNRLRYDLNNHTVRHLTLQTCRGSLPLSRIISALVIFIYLWIDSKKLESWKYILTFSIFISFVTEGSHIIAYTSNRYLMQSLGISDFITSSNPLLFIPIV